MPLPGLWGHLEPVCPRPVCRHCSQNRSLHLQRPASHLRVSSPRATCLRPCLRFLAPGLTGVCPTSACARPLQQNKCPRWEGCQLHSASPGDVAVVTARPRLSWPAPRDRRAVPCPLGTQRRGFDQAEERTAVRGCCRNVPAPLVVSPGSAGDWLCRGRRHPKGRAGRGPFPGLPGGRGRALSPQQLQPPASEMSALGRAPC